jgi:hypothetical protein
LRLGARSLCWIGARILARRQALPQIIASQQLDVLQFLLESGWTTDGPVNIGHYSYFIGAIPPNAMVSATS